MGLKWPDFNRKDRWGLRKGKPKGRLRCSAVGLFAAHMAKRKTQKRRTILTTKTTEAAQRKGKGGGGVLFLEDLQGPKNTYLPFQIIGEFDFLLAGSYH